MIKHSKDIELVDQYVRNELTADEEAEFEVRMLQSPPLQRYVQTALGIKEALRLGEKHAEPSLTAMGGNRHSRKNTWKSMALAASVLLAAFSTLMLVKTNNEAKELKRQIEKLNQPKTSILTVPVDIMRSSESGSPDVIVQKPSARTLIQLDIELTRQSQTQSALQFALYGDGPTPLARWEAIPLANGRTIALLRSEQIPTGLVELQISDIDGKILEHHLLEFKPHLD